MDFGVGSFLFAFLAGVLSTLSPCVLPLIPIIIGAATNQHRLGPFALAGGLTLSFAVIGTTLAGLGSSIGIAQDGFRLFAAVIMGLIGIVLISTHLQERFAVAMSGISGAGNTHDDCCKQTKPILSNPNRGPKTSQGCTNHSKRQCQAAC